MKEAIKQRLDRLGAKKREIQGRMAQLRQNDGTFNRDIHNAELKWNILNDELNRIGARMIEIRDAARGKGVA